MEIGGFIHGYEDNYGGQEYETVKDIADHIEEVAFSEYIGDINWPVWVEVYPADPKYTDEQNITEVAWFLPRKGRTYIDFCYAIDEEQTVRIRAMLLRFWAGRADIQFSRYGTARLAELGMV